MEGLTMGIITDIRVPADSFPLGRILQAYPEVTIELERIVPLTDEIIPLFWVQSERDDVVEAALRDDPLVETITQLTRTPERILYAINWSPNINALMGTLLRLGVTVLSADGTATDWEFRLQFTDQDQLSRFQRACQEKGIPLDLRRLYNPVLPAEEGLLSPEQTAALTMAYEHGYWNIPREITQSELANRLGISANALSERLRRGTNHLVADWLYNAGDHQ